MRAYRLLGVACLVAFAAVTVSGQSGAADGEWRSYGGDLGHTRYAPLSQIDSGNFNNNDTTPNRAVSEAAVRQLADLVSRMRQPA